MQVFKAYLKIIEKNKGQLLMYLGIVVALAIMMTMFNAQSNQTGFAATKVNIAFFNDDAGIDTAADSGTSIVSGLHDYLAQIAIIEDVADNPEAIRDALFFGKIYYAVRVPQGFAASFDQDGSSQIETVSAPGSTTSIYLELLINKYLNTAKLYRKGLPDASTAEIIRLTSENLAISTPVEVKTFQTRQGSYDNIVYYFNYLAYALLSILILGVSTCMMTFNNLDLKRRNLCSPLTQRSMNLQLIAGNLVFSLFSWAIMIIVSLVLYFRSMLSPAGLLFGLNSLVFMIVGLCLSFMIGNLLKSRNAQAAVSNVLTLGTCFIAGVFVPQAILGKTVLAIARVTPTYWYVKANSEIGSLSSISARSLNLIWPSLAIQLLFAAVFLALSWIIIRKRRQQA